MKTTQEYFGAKRDKLGIYDILLMVMSHGHRPVNAKNKSSPFKNKKNVKKFFNRATYAHCIDKGVILTFENL